MIRFLLNNLFSNSVVNASSAALSAANLRNDKPYLGWRTTGVTAQWVKFDLQSSLEVSLFTLVRNNLTDAATVTLYGDDSDLGSTEAAWAVAAFSEALDFDNEMIVSQVGGTYRYWFVAFDDPSNTDGFIEVGSVFGGSAISPSENFNENFSEKNFDSSFQSASEGGHIFSVQKARWREFEIQFLDIDRGNKAMLESIWNAAGVREPLVVAFDPDDFPVTQTVYGKFTNEGGLTFRNQAYQRYSLDLSFRQMR